MCIHKYYSGTQKEKNDMGRACGTYGGQWRDVYGVLMGKLEGRRPLGRLRRMWEYKIRLKQI